MTQTKTLHVAITGGIRQDLSEHTAPPGTLQDAVNVRFSAVGEVESRPGTTALDFSSDADVGYAAVLDDPGMLAPVRGGFAVGTAGFGYNFDVDQGHLFVGASYANAEPLGVLDTIAREEVTVSFANQNGTPWPLSQAYRNGYLAVVHSCGNGQAYGPAGAPYHVGTGDSRVVLRVYTADGTLVTSAQYDNTSAAFLVVDGSSSTDIILVTQNTTTDIAARIITTAATGVTIGSSTSVGTLNAAGNFWAACTWPGIGWALLHQSAAALARIAKVAGQTVATTQNFAVTGVVPVSVYCDTTNLYAGWVEGAAAPVTASARVYDTSLTLTSGVGAVTIASEATDKYLGPPLFGPSISAATANYVVSRAAAPAIGSETWMYAGDLTAAGTATALATVYHCYALSCPFANGYVWVRSGSAKDSFSSRYERALLLDFMGLRSSAANTEFRKAQPVVALSGVALSGAEGSAYPGGFYLQHVGVPSQLADGSWVMGIPRIVRLETVPAGGLGGFTIGEWLQFTLGGTRQSATLGDEVVVSGFPALVHPNTGSFHYDGTNSLSIQRDGIDLGTPITPGMDTPTTSNSTGSLTSSSLYQWRAVLERIDSKGRRWRSAPSVVVSKTTGASDDTAALTARINPDILRAGTFNSLFYYRLDSRFVMHFYRTVANGQQFFRCTPPQGAPTTTTTGVFAFTDELSDGSLQAREILYTDGGVLGNDAPPSARFVDCTEDRVWFAGLWEPEQLQSSKVLVPGEPPQFSDLASFRVVLPGPCTGIKAQDGVLFAFTREAIFAVQGTGPNDQGQGAWDSPRCITNSTGCISHLSLLVTSVGIFFQSEQGIELLPRGGGEPQFVGMPVQDLMYSTSLGRVASVTSASVVTTFRGRTARFCIGDVGGSSYVLVYDLDTQAWSRDQYGVDVITGICDTDRGAVLITEAVSGNYGGLREDIAGDRDYVGNSPTEIASSVTWSRIRPFGIAGEGRFTGAIGLFDAKGSPSSGYRSGNATIKVTVDRFSESGKSFNLSTLNQPDYRKHVPLNPVGSAAELTLSAASGGWRFMGWTVELEDHGGGRRMGETEQG